MAYILLNLSSKIIEYFPYSSVRPFQDKFIRTVYFSLNKGSHVVIEGYNGLGLGLLSNPLLATEMKFVKHVRMKLFVHMN